MQDFGQQFWTLVHVGSILFFGAVWTTEISSSGSIQVIIQWFPWLVESFQLGFRFKNSWNLFWSKRLRLNPKWHNLAMRPLPNLHPITWTCSLATWTCTCFAPAKRWEAAAVWSPQQTKEVKCFTIHVISCSNWKLRKFMYSIRFISIVMINHLHLGCCCLMDLQGSREKKTPW